MTTKVLWCDRNYDYVESFIEATKHILPDIEFILKDEPVDVIKEILTNGKQYKLIISGQIFKNMNGTDLFEIIFNNKVHIPFLLLTAQIDYNQFAQYDLWYSFSYMDKLKAHFYEVAEKVKELINRDITATYQLHEKLKAIRVKMKMTTQEMARLVGTTENDVIASESEYLKVVSSYVNLVSSRFDIPLSILLQSTTTYFQNFIEQKFDQQEHLEFKR